MRIFLILACLAVAGLLIWGFGDDSDTRTVQREEAVEPEPERVTVTPTPEPEPETKKPQPKPEPEPKQPAVPTADPETGALRIKVVDQDGRPIPDARVKIIGPDASGKWTTLGDKPSDDAGFDGLPHARMVAMASRGSYSRSRPITPAKGRWLDLEIPLPAGTTVTGTVSHADRGPLASVTLQMNTENKPYRDSFRTTTDEEGRYELTHVPVGKHPLKLTGQAVGYEQHHRTVLDVPSLAGPFLRDIVLGGVSMSGVIRDSVTRAPLNGVTVQIQRPYYADVATGDDGTYAFRDLAPAKIHLVLVREGYETRFYRDLEVPGKHDLEMVRAAILHIRVTDQNGEPVRGRVELSVNRIGSTSALGTSIKTGDDGRTDYNKLSPGKYRLGFKTAQSERVDLEVTIVPGENTLDVVLETAAPTGAISLEGVIRDANTGDAIPGVTVRMPRTRPRKEVTTDAKGRYELRELQPGKHKLYVSKDGFAFHIVNEVETVAGKATTLDLKLKPAATVRLTVLDPQGTPVTGNIYFGMLPIGHDGTRLGTGVDLDAQGVGFYRQILPGRYTLRVGREGEKAAVEVDVRLGTNEVEFRLK